MKKFLNLEKSVQLRDEQQSCCHSGSLCFRCSMIALTSHRFAMFQRKFGRLPGPSEELFFDESQPEPIRASIEAIKSQLFDAAEARGLNFFVLLSCLGLNSTVMNEQLPN